MTHKKDWIAGELSWHYKPTAISGIEKDRTRGSKAVDSYKLLGTLMADHGQLDPYEMRDHWNNYIKHLEGDK